MMTAAQPARGFRVTVDELSNEDAMMAMNAACNRVVETALEARRDLLNLGFAVEHSMCKDLDRIASHFTTNREVVLRQLEQEPTPIRPDK